jgi:hypothetical protein
MGVSRVFSRVYFGITLGAIRAALAAGFHRNRPPRLGKRRTRPPETSAGDYFPFFCPRRAGRGAQAGGPVTGPAQDLAFRK